MIPWTAFDGGVLDFMSRVSAHIKNCSARVLSLLEMTPLSTPEGVERLPVSGNSSNFRVACKRQYISEMLHTHITVFSLKKIWLVSIRGPKEKKKWLWVLFNSPGSSHNGALLESPQPTIVTTKDSLIPRNVFWSKHNWNMMKMWLS